MDLYGQCCKDCGLEFEKHESVLPPDNSTLFVTSGMQKRKGDFRDGTLRRKTLGDVQRCLRLNDLDEIGDGTHWLDFWMLGLFSFRHWSPKEGVEFWLGFLEKVGVLPDTVTIHPECGHHRKLYGGVDVKIVEDPGNVWTDGDIGGYCTEFYRDGVEIGNIVIPLGDCLDCGFGLERIGGFIPGWSEPKPDRGLVLGRTVELLLSQGVSPGPNKQGYVLRKLIRTGLREGIVLPCDPWVEKERQGRERMLMSLPRLLKKHVGKGRGFFKDSFGIDPEDMPSDWPS